MKDADIISGYNQLPLDKYNQLREIVMAEGAEEVDIRVSIIAVLTGLTEDEVLRLPIDTFMAYNLKSAFLNEAPTKEHRRIASEYRIGDFVLVPVADIRKITTGQYIDLKTFLKDANEHVVEILSCLLIPQGKDYCEGYDILDVQKALARYMNVADAFALIGFFLDSLTASMRRTATSWKRHRRPRTKQMEAIKMEVEKLTILFSSDGDGRQM